MANQWFRSWHGAPTDDKWIIIAKRSETQLYAVSAFVWALYDHASQNEERGQVSDFDFETYAAKSGMEEELARKIFKAMEEAPKDKPVIKNGHLANWEKRQPKREDSSTSRVKKHRETQCNATKRNGTLDKDADEDEEEIRLEKKEFAKRKANGNSFHFAFSGEPFAGEVIQLDGPGFEKLFSAYSNNGDEARFRKLLEKRDCWYVKQPYRTYADGKWLTDTCKWLLKNKENLTTTGA